MKKSRTQEGETEMMCVREEMRQSSDFSISDNRNSLISSKGQRKERGNFNVSLWSKLSLYSK